MLCCNNTRSSAQSDSLLSGGCTPERICVQVKRVFDACIDQFTRESASLTVTFPTPVVSFVSANSAPGSVISNLVITPQPGSVNSRVQYTVTVPIVVAALDTNGNTVIGTTCATFNQDILLRVPQGAIVQPEVQVTANVLGVNGYVQGYVCTLSLCVTLITKIVADVDILIQSLGYCSIPACQAYTEDICSGAFSQPIYPR